MKESKLFKSLLATIVAVGLGVPAMVLASTSSHLETNSITVFYADLNLGNEAGVQVLYRRLQRASSEVCGDRSLTLLGSTVRLQQVNQCYGQTLAEAVKTIDNEHLTRIHVG